VQGDVLDIPSLDAAVQGQDAVLHAAGLVSFRRHHRQALKLVNETGTANVVNAMLDAGVPRLVLVSSTAALGRTQPGEHIDESHKMARTPLDSYYGWSKHLAERQAQRGLQEGLQVAIANPSVVLSATFERSSGALVARAARGLRYSPPGANGFVAEWDVARALGLLLVSPFVSGERFILNGQNLSYHQLFALWLQALGKPAPSGVVGARWVRGLARVASWVGAPTSLTPEVATTLTNTVSYDNGAFARAFGFTFTPIAEALKHIAQSRVAHPQTYPLPA
jgi:nucleoside-diphosphate-sugar epimerase